MFRSPVLIPARNPKLGLSLASAPLPSPIKTAAAAAANILKAGAPIYCSLSIK
jgi:hypothetical protein